MNVRGALAAVTLLVGALGGCATPTGEDDSAPEEEQPLDLTIDAVDVVHGALRISATMVDGAADVSVRLAGCGRAPVGGGLATPSSIVWSLSDRDLASAIPCLLQVHARVRDGSHYVQKFAQLRVGVGVAPEDGETPPDAPQEQSVEKCDTGVLVGFIGIRRGARLTTSDSILESVPPEADDTDPTAGESKGLFLIPHLDFARSLLQGRPLHLDGASFAVSMTVGDVAVSGPQESEETPALDLPQEPDPPQETPDEDDPTEQVEEG